MQTIGRTTSTSRVRWLILAVLAIAAQAFLAAFLRSDSGRTAPPAQLSPSSDECTARDNCAATSILKIA